MIKALSWAFRQHPDKISSLEKLVLIGLSDRSSEEFYVDILKWQLVRFTGMHQEELDSILDTLIDKGFIEKIEPEVSSTKNNYVYKLIAY